MQVREPVQVIGGGFGGLSAAITLASRGWQVVLHEQQERLGGKANTKTIDGFRFDTGPSLLTLPDVFRRLFSLSGRDIESYIDIIPLSPLTRYWFPDGTHFSSDLIDRFIPTLVSHLDVTEAAVQRYFAYARRIWDITHNVFLERSLHRFSTYCSIETLHSLLRIGSIDLGRTMHRANEHFFSDPRMVQLLDRYATYNGSDPYQAPATLNNISYVEHGLGGFGVSDGIYGIISGMERLARELGVEIHTSSQVTRISTDYRRAVTRITVNDEQIPARQVISDVDVITLYDQLLEDPNAPLVRRYRRLPSSSSAMVFYWGVNRSFDALGVHNIFFSEDYRREFAQIHQLNEVPSDPTIYVNITSKITDTDAPAGSENWFVLVNAPPHDGRDWEADLETTRETLIKRLSAILGVELEHHIVVEACWTPEAIERETGSHRGALYGISSNSKMAAFLRHPNLSKRYPGLYLCGGSVHPGGGMPLATLSGMIAADLLMTRDGGSRWES